MRLNPERASRKSDDATAVLVKIPPAEFAVLDAWIAKQLEPGPSHPAALRRLAGLALAAKSKP